LALLSVEAILRERLAFAVANDVLSDLWL
jgi:hypothetical protein